MSNRSLVILLGALIGLSPLAIDMYLPSMPAIADDLTASSESVQNTVSIYLVFFAIPQLFFGPMADAFGRRLVIFSGMLFFLAGCLLAAVAPNIETLLLARALQGTGSAAFSVTVPALVKDKFNGDEYTRAVGFVMMVMSIAPLVAPIVGGFVFIAGGWRSNFYLLAVLAVVCGVFFFRMVEESLPDERRVPLNIEKLLKNYGRLISDRHCLGLCLGIGGMVAGLMAFIAGSPFVLIELYGVPEQYYGFLFGINVLVMMLMTYLNNRLIHLFDNQKLLWGCTALIFVASVYLLAIAQMDRPAVWMIMLGSALFIGNLGMFSANTQVILLSRFAQTSGAAAALMGAFRFGVGSLGGFAIGRFHASSAAPLLMVMGVCGLFICAVVAFAGKKPIESSSA
ncbi:Bcr/CflA family multidrug efflux MFS transporter [Aurantivibrio plasticivorans]